MTLSDDEQGVGQEFFASAEGGTTGRDAANLESIFHVDLDDVTVHKDNEYDDEDYNDNSYHTNDDDNDYVDEKTKSQQRRNLKDFRLYGAQDFSKKIKEELGIN